LTASILSGAPGIWVLSREGALSEQIQAVVGEGDSAPALRFLTRKRSGLKNLHVLAI
jgi:hypothetical protein